MRHPGPEELLDLALGTLEARRADEARRHLGACGECAGARRELEEEQGILKKHFSDRPSPSRALEARILFSTHPQRDRATVPAIAVMVAAFLLVGTLGLIFFGPADDSDWVREQLAIKSGQASAAFDEGEHQEAIRIYNDIISMLDGREDFKSNGAEIRRLKEQVEEYMAQILEGERRMETLEDRFAATSISASEMTELKADARALNDQFSAVEGVEWLPRLTILREKMQKAVDSSLATEKRQDYQVMRQSIIDASRLDQGTGAKADWSDAIRRWKEYVAMGGISEVDKEKARGDIRRLNARAKEDLAVIRIRVRNVIQEGRRADAVLMIKSAHPRFEMTESIDDLEMLLEETRP